MVVKIDVVDVVKVVKFYMDKNFVVFDVVMFVKVVDDVVVKVMVVYIKFNV